MLVDYDEQLEDVDEDDIFYPGQFDYENNQVLKEALKTIEQNSKSSSRYSLITVIISLLSLLVAIISVVIQLI